MSRGFLALPTMLITEIVGEFVVTGSKVYMEGKLQRSSWEDRQSGQTKYRTEIVARDLVLLSVATELVNHGRVILIQQHTMKPQPRTPRL
jgi:single-stranded DNA-binding protein